MANTFRETAPILSTVSDVGVSEHLPTMSAPEKNNSLPKKKEDVEGDSTDNEAEDEKLFKAPDDCLAPTQDEQDAAKTKPLPSHDDDCNVCTEICLRYVDESKSGETSEDEDEIIGDLLLNEVLHAVVRSSEEDQEVSGPKLCCQSPAESSSKIDVGARGSKTYSCKEEIPVTDIPDQPSGSSRIGISDESFERLIDDLTGVLSHGTSLKKTSNEDTDQPLEGPQDQHALGIQRPNLEDQPSDGHQHDFGNKLHTSTSHPVPEWPLPNEFSMCACSEEEALKVGYQHHVEIPVAEKQDLASTINLHFPFFFSLMTFQEVPTVRMMRLKILQGLCQLRTLQMINMLWTSTCPSWRINLLMDISLSLAKTCWRILVTSGLEFPPMKT